MAVPKLRTKLYMVVQEPKPRWRRAMASIVYHTYASGKVDALEQFQQKRGDLADLKYHKKPYAVLITTGVTTLI